MPSPKSWIPPKKYIDTTIDVQPLTACPLIFVINAHTPMQKLKNAINAPKSVKIRSGFMLKLVIPSIAKLNILKNGYLETPATRAIRL